MPGKALTPLALAQDAEYVVNGTIYHQRLYAICPPRPGMSVLEPGAGSGKLSLAYAMLGADVTLLDIDPGVLEYEKALARLLSTGRANVLGVERLFPVGHITFIEGDLHQMEALFPTERFDLVLSEGVSYHWPRDDPRRQGSIDKMTWVTKPGGTVVVIGNNAHNSEIAEMHARTDHTYAGMPERAEPFTSDEFRELLRHAGLAGVTVAPCDTPHYESSRTLIGWGRKP